MDIISLLSTDGYIVCNKTLIKLFGAEAAILIGELCAEYNYFQRINELDENGSFYSTQTNIEENTGLNAYAQRKAIKTLTDAGIIEVTKKGLPAKNYFKIFDDKLLNIFTTSPLNFEGLEVQNLNINNNNKKIIKNNTLSKDSVRTSSKISETNFFLNNENNIQKPKKKTNEEEYLDCCLLIDNFTDNKELNKKLKELFRNKKDECSKKRHHFYATTCKQYLEELNEIDDKLGAVKLSIQYSNTMRVMQPNNSSSKFNSNDSKYMQIKRNGEVVEQKKFNPDTDTLSDVTF